MWQATPRCPFPGGVLSADFGAAIDWNHLPPSCQSCSPEDSVALADFCYRVAVGLHMDFGGAESGSDFPAEQTLVTHYEYPNTMVRIPFSDPLAFAQIRDEINARRPLRVTLLFTASHYLNFDGWGLEEDGDRWYHANDDGGGAWWSEPSLNLDDDALGGIRSPLVVESVLVTPDGVGGDYPNIQAAVDAVPDGCRIVLADGTFRGAGNRDIDFHGKEVTVGSASGDPATCIIDCEGSPTNPHRGFYFHTGETGAAVVRDITVIGGYVTEALGGGAIVVRNATATTITSPLILNCVLQGNHATVGGAVASYGRPCLERCLLVENHGGKGSALYVYGSGALVQNCTIAANTSDLSSQGAVHVTAGSSVYLVKCVVADNSGVSTSCGPRAHAEYRCSDIWNNNGGAGDWEYPGSCISGLLGIHGNIREDPLFCAESYLVARNSPCVGGECELMGLGVCAGPATWHVPFNFTNLAAAFADERVENGDIIELTELSYTGEGNRDLFCSKSLTIRSETGDPNTCVVDVQGSRDDNHRFLTVPLLREITLEGIRIQGGFMYGTGDAGRGGGLLAAGIALTMSNCVLANNEAREGGGFASTGYSVILDGCRVQSCRSGGGAGGGVVAGAGTVIARYTLFLENEGECDAKAGALWLDVGSVGEVDHCTLVGNAVDTTTSCHPLGSAIALGTYATLSISNTVIADGIGEVAAVGGCGQEEIATATCTDVVGNYLNWAGCLDGQLGMEGNIETDPEFCEDYHSDVLCCVAGCGQIGAYGPCAAPRPGPQSVEEPFIDILGANPGHDLTLRFGVPGRAAGEVLDLSIYGAAGGHVRRLFAGAAGRAAREVKWDGRNDAGVRAGCGVYFVRLSAEGQASKIQRIVVLR